MKDEGGKMKAENARITQHCCAHSSSSRIPHPSSRTPHPASRIPHPSSCSSAFTLVELLVTITILSIIAATVMFASFQATKAARRDATRAKVNAINALLMERYNSYGTRRVRLPRIIENAVRNRVPNEITQIQAEKELHLRRLSALRELMKLEMPDRWSDVTLGGIAPAPAGSTVNNPYSAPVFLFFNYYNFRSLC